VTGHSKDASRAPIGIAGGSFDPVHNGHLRMALELGSVCGLAEVRLVPSARPPHRDGPQAAADVRLKMLEAAVSGCPGLAVDRRELERGGPSYTVDTLTSLQAELPGRSLCLLLGLDAFLDLPAWHRWERILELAHIVVAQRPGSELPTDGIVGELLAERRISSPAGLAAIAAGCIMVENVTQLEISSSAIRALVAGGGDPRFLVPETVRELIEQTGCYGRPLTMTNSGG